MELVRITGPADVRCAELRERAAEIPLTKVRWQFVAIDNTGQELAFLSFDIRHGKDYVVLYYLWVARVHRGVGVGTAVLDEACRIAKDTGHARLLALPRPVDADVTERALRAWYRRRGFTPWPRQRRMLQRAVDGDR